MHHPDRAPTALNQHHEPTLRLDYRDQVLRAERAGRDLVGLGLSFRAALELTQSLDRARSAFEAFAALQLATELEPEAAMTWLRRHDYVAAVQEVSRV